MIRFLSTLHVLATALLLLWGWWTFRTLSDSYTRLWHLERTVDMFVLEVPEATEAKFAWCSLDATEAMFNRHSCKQ